MAIRECYEKCLPHGVWCKCGHISGQHSVKHPHKCATNGYAGCENQCSGFRPAEQKSTEVIPAV